MVNITDRFLHIHQNPGQACIACGDFDDGSRLFTTDTGLWNRDAKSCSFSSIVSPQYVLIPRDDPRTSALKDERHPDPDKTPPDQR